MKIQEATMSDAERATAGCGDDRMSKPKYPNAHLIAAAPAIYEAMAGLVGLIELLLNRSDSLEEVREVLTYDHRVTAAYDALAKAAYGGMG